MTIYLSIFDRRSNRMSSSMEALVAKNVRRALGMFGDIIVSPHLPTTQITGTVITGGESRFQDNLIMRALMRGRYKFFNGQSGYVRNILNADMEGVRPSNLLNADILEYLIRNRKVMIDFSQEGYITLGTLTKKMGLLGYDEADVATACKQLVGWGLVEPEGLMSVEGNEAVLTQTLGESDALRVHASGFVHMRQFLANPEYLIGITPAMNFTSRSIAETMGNHWRNDDHLHDLKWTSKRDILSNMRAYFVAEYERRCKRHAFYEELGFGGKLVVESVMEAERTFAPSDTEGRSGKPVSRFRKTPTKSP